MKPLHIRLTTAASLVLLVALSRFLPHPPNAAPVMAMALFGGAMFDKKWVGLVVPTVAMLLSDAVIGFHGTMGAVYSSFALAWLIGAVALRQPTFAKVVAGSVVASVLFFLITNFAVWYGSSFYPQTGAGLLGCYAAGMAFYNNQSFFVNALLGDLFFSGLLFGGYALLQRRYSVLKMA
jgi:signal transduction histidine kinase